MSCPPGLMADLHHSVALTNSNNTLAPLDGFEFVSGQYFLIITCEMCSNNMQIDIMFHPNTFPLISAVISQNKCSMSPESGQSGQQCNVRGCRPAVSVWWLLPDLHTRPDVSLCQCVRAAQSRVWSSYFTLAVPPADQVFSCDIMTFRVLLQEEPGHTVCECECEWVWGQCERVWGRVWESVRECQENVRVWVSVSLRKCVRVWVSVSVRASLKVNASERMSVSVKGSI